MDKRRDDTMAQVGKYLSLAFVLPSAAFAGYIIGYLLDQAFGTSFLRVVVLLLGIIGGLVEVLRTLLRDTSKP
jgi:F0F1-type ATP synthase assembly protein I